MASESSQLWSKRLRISASPHWSDSTGYVKARVQNIGDELISRTLSSSFLSKGHAQHSTVSLSVHRPDCRIWRLASYTPGAQQRCSVDDQLRVPFHGEMFYNDREVTCKARCKVALTVTTDRGIGRCLAEIETDPIKYLILSGTSGLQYGFR
jgi:hypothetical protein